MMDHLTRVELSAAIDEVLDAHYKGTLTHDEAKARLRGLAERYRAEGVTRQAQGLTDGIRQHSRGPWNRKAEQERRP